MDETLQEAIKLIETGFHEDGLEKVEKMITEADDETKRTIAELYFELGLVDRALELAEELMFKYPDQGELFAFASECYIELGKEEEALDMLNEIKKDDPAFLQAQLLLADLYESEGLEEVAETKLLDALKIMPDESILQLGLAEFYLNRGDYQEAISYFKQAVYSGKLPEDLPIDPHVRLAEAFSATGQFEDALENYKEGLKKDQTPDGLFGFGFTALQLEDYTTAIDSFNTLLEQDPDYTSAYGSLAKAYMAIKKWEEARETLKEGINRDEYNEELYLQMAKLQLSQGEGEDGREFLKKVIAMNPSNVSAVQEALYYYDDTEDYEEMIELIRFLDDYNEFDPLYERFRAKALFEENDINGAAQAMDVALSTLSRDERLLEDAAVVYLANRQKEKALPLLEEVLKLDPEREDIRRRIEELI
ncbi:tetratricopeptide repeat protein [Alkalicoccus halolimnae]|uniref:Tetratricopeptide repeat protein n=1 Tax=Alkalicoccus halolimnae TaxID=1667239 RepID=A0A5C7FAB0_9BACI|nr:tetratricopeptide repeat protein [Alkalicoccus halolimnae]TXF82995.1 tetratricopeptide repeat protein [Alkalicoccus halolimnae]